MKRFIFFARVYFGVFCCLPLTLEAQEVASFPNFVVIGAFAHHKNAVNFTGDANQHKFPARFEMNPNRNLYYVYVLTTSDRAYAIAEAVKLRAETKYFDTWVYSGPLGSMTVANGKVPQGEDINPLTGHSFKSPGPQNEAGANPSLSPASQEDSNDSRVEDTPLSENIDLDVETIPEDQATEKNSRRRNRRTNRLANDVGQPGKPNAGKVAVGLETTSNGQTEGQADHGTDETVNTAQPLLVGNESNGSLQRAARSSATEKGAVAQGTDAAQQGSPKIGGEKNALRNDATTGDGSRTENVLRDDVASAPSPLRNKDVSNQTTFSTGQLEGSPDTSGSGQNSQSDGRDKARHEDATRDSGLPADGQSDPRQVVQASLSASDNVTQYDAADDGPQTDAETQDATKPPVDHSQNTDASAAQFPPPKRMTTEPLKTEELVDKNFYFHLFRADNANMIEGEVDAIDFAKSRRMATYPGNKPVTVKMPGGKLQHVSFLCQVFGYRKQQKEFDPNSPDQDLYIDDKGNIVVPFELIRLQKGDIAIMYNVFFFKDAAVMRPESRYEVNNLLALLEENPTYKIMIHGHTNGNASGKIIRMETPGNFYSLSGTKQGVGSAKKLSEERARVIREFLISSGIQQDRMQLKAWGGKKPIHDKLSARAHENVRVEIEILPD